MQNIVHDIIKQLKEIRSIYEAILRSHQYKGKFIVSSEDSMYTVGVTDERKLKVQIGSALPYIFHDEFQAKEAAQKFHATNGKGIIVWHVQDLKKFIDARLPDMEEMLDQLNTLLIVDTKSNLVRPSNPELN